MSKYKPKHRYPDNYTPHHRVPSRSAEFIRRHPRLVFRSLAGILVGAVAAGGANEIRNVQHEYHPATSDTCHISGITDTGETYERRMPNGVTVRVDRVIVQPHLELTPRTEDRFMFEHPEVHAGQILPGGTEIRQVQGHYESDQTGQGEVVLEPPKGTREGALMEFAVGSVPCVDGLVYKDGQWGFAGPIEQYESGLQRGNQSAP